MPALSCLRPLIFIMVKNSFKHMDENTCFSTNREDHLYFKFFSFCFETLCFYCYTHIKVFMSSMHVRLMIGVTLLFLETIQSLHE